MIAVLVCVIFSDPIKDRIILLYWQRQCLNYSNSGRPVSLAVSSQPPPCWVKFNTANGTPITAQNPSGCVFLGCMKCPDGVDRLVFVEVQAGAGDNGALDWFVNTDGTLGLKTRSDSLRWMQALVMRPATIDEDAAAIWGKNPRRMPGVVLTISLPYDSNANDRRNEVINGAVLDRGNPSHFTIQTNFSDGSSNPIDGYLDNNDVLTIRQRTPP